MLLTKIVLRRRKRLRNHLSSFFLLAVFLLFPLSGYAETLSFDLGEGGKFSNRLVQLILLISIISVAPSILVMVTSFTRIVIVLSFLRSALGLQQTPPNSVLISLALFLTAFIMNPTFEVIYENSIRPLVAEKIDETKAFEEAKKPLAGFMAAHVREKDFALFVSLSKDEDKITSAETAPLQVLIPAFMISELRRAFEIGFLIFIPFVIIDMLVASVLMAMGMMMLPPVMISLPFKLVFFVIVDGWHLICGSLIKSFS
jgi:flagellar biosynthetic protein FliP